MAENDPNFSVRRIKASFRKRCNSLSGLQVGEKAIQTFLCGGSRLPFGSGAIPFRETLGVHRECTRSAPGVHRECTRRAPGGHQKCTRSEPGVHQECTRSAPGIHQECTRSLGHLLGLLNSALLFMTWQRRMPAWGPLGLLSSALLFMTWQRESANLSLLIFSAVFCCS